MNISIHQSCLDLFKGVRAQSGYQSSFIDDLAQAAQNAWDTREEGCNIARFAYQVPSEYGQRFHFFTVMSYRKGSNILSVRG